MASIQKRINNGKASYTVKVRLKGHKPQFATFERRTDARRWAQQIETQIKEGRYFKSSESRKHTLAKLVERFERDVLPSKPKIIKEYSRNLDWWKSEIGELTLMDVTPAVISELRDKLGRASTHMNKKRSNATVNRYLAALSSAFTTAVKEWGWIDENPLHRVSRFKEPRGRVRFLSDDEREKLLRACRESSNKDLYLAVVLALSTGARKKEIWNLRWKNIDLKNRMIFLDDTKNGEFRSLPLNTHALNLILNHSKIRRIDTDLVFPSKKSSFVAIDFRKPWEKALLKAGIEDFRWHDLRHSCASYLAMNGVPLRTIAEILGHKTLQMVHRYTHLSNKHIFEALDLTNSKIFP